MPTERRVLVVDDDKLIRHVTRDWLEAAGFHVNTLDNSAGIVAAVEAHRPDVVLLDLMMPADDDVTGEHIVTGGVVALARLAAHHGPPVILMSGVVPDAVGVEIASEGQNLHAVSFLAKPFDLEQLLAVVAQALEAADG